MKFLTVVSLTLVLATSAFAEPIKDIARYQTAIYTALNNQKPLNCTWADPKWNWSSGTLADTIEVLKFNSGDVSGGTQPLLVLRGGDGQTFSMTFTITTTADYRTIVSVDYLEQDCAIKPVNHGDLQNPEMTTQLFCKTVATASCK